MLKIGDLTLSVPIIQGGMGIGISLSGLASAVANEGGIGVISSAGLGLIHRSPGEKYQDAIFSGLRTEIRKARELSKGIIGVNIMVALTDYAELVKTSIDENIDIIFSGAGLPLDLPSYLTPGSKTKLVPIVSSGRAAKIICDKWKTNYNYLPDALVLEGPEAGGHLGYKTSQLNDEKFSLEQLLPEVLAVAKEYEEKYQCSMPVFAAGGICSGEEMAKIMEQGAAGVQMGSIFVTTNECDASLTFKESFVNAKKEDVVIIQSPVGMPGRAIRNSFVDRIAEGNCKPKGCAYHCIKTCKYPETPYCIIMSLFNAYKGNMDKGYAFAGASAYKATEIKSVKAVVHELMSGYKDYMAEKASVGNQVAI